MAKYIFSDNGKKSGKADATVFMRNGVSRDWIYPNNTYSDLKQFQIECISFYSSQWQFLTQDEMILWQNYSYTHHDSFYNNIVVKGAQAFIGTNSNMALKFLNNSTIYFTSPNQRSRPFENITNLSTSIDSVNYLITCDTSLVLRDVALYTSDNLSPGVFKPRRCDFYFCTFIDLNSGSADVTSAMSTRLGTSPISGSKIFTRLIPFDRVSGTYATAFQVSSIVA
ncbi:MAG TPA: hypothetical protein VK590_01285 [Saprospiraceae bacterium]|nr:hypothetical protein [Saprospiraceae bacterium]